MKWPFPIWIAPFLLLLACTGRTEQFVPPEFVALEAQVDGASALLKGTLSESRVDRVGFILHDDEQETVLQGTLKGTSFTAEAKGLEVGKTYRWEAFAKAGNSEIRSREQSLTAPEGAIPIPDPVFKEQLINWFDRDADGSLSVQEAKMALEVDLKTDAIASLQGLEYLPNLRILQAAGSEPGKGLLKELDVSHNPELRVLSCINNRITSLDVSHNPDLEHLSCWQNSLTELDVSHNPKLLELSCAQNYFTSLDVSHNPLLTQLHFNDTFVDDIDLQANSCIRIISCWRTPLTQLDVSPCKHLEELWSFSTMITSFHAVGISEIRSLDLGDSPLKSLDISDCSKIERLYLNNTDVPFSELPDLTQFPLTGLHLSTIAKDMPSDYLRNFPLLTELNICGFNGKSVDLSKNTKLEALWCASMGNVASLDLSAAPNLRELYMTGCPKLTTVYVANGIQLQTLEKDEHTQIKYKESVE